MNEDSKKTESLIGAGMDRRGLLRSAAWVGAAAAAAGVGAATPVEAQAPGNVLNTVILPEPPLLVLGLNNQGPTLIVGSKIYEGLLKYDSKLNPLPGLAKSWEISADAKTYTFKLQEGATFHDGKPCTAEDVVFSIMKFHMEVSPRSRAIFQRIKDAKVIDPLTAQFTLEAPFEPLIMMFDVTAAAIVPKHLYEGTDFRANPNNTKPIGTGPFLLKEWVRGNYIHLAKYDGYWKKGEPMLDSIYYRIIPDSANRTLALQTGQISLTTGSDIEPFEVPRFRQMPNMAVATNGWELFAPLAWLDMNHRVKPLDDKRFRRALMMAIDRKLIVDRLWFGIGKPATSPIASATRFHDPAVAMPAFDVRAANALLDEMGLKRGADGNRVTLKLMHLPYGEVWTRLGEYVKQAAAQIGVNLTLELTDGAGWNRRVGEWDYELTFNFVYQWGDPTLGVQRTYISSNIQKITFTNTMGYKNEQVDDLFIKAANAASSAERAKLFSDVQKLLVEDMPVGWLIEMAFPTIHDKRLQNAVVLGTGVHAPYGDVKFA